MSIDLLIIGGIALLLFGTLYFKGTALILGSVLSATFSLYTAQYLFTSGVLSVSPFIQKILVAILLLLGIASFSSIIKNRTLRYSLSKKLLAVLIAILATLYIVGMYLQLLPGTLYEFTPAIRDFYITKIGFTGVLFLIPFILPFLLRKVD